MSWLTDVGYLPIIHNVLAAATLDVIIIIIIITTITEPVATAAAAAAINPGVMYRTSVARGN